VGVILKVATFFYPNSKSANKQRIPE